MLTKSTKRRSSLVARSLLASRNKPKKKIIGTESFHRLTMHRVALVRLRDKTEVAVPDAVRTPGRRPGSIVPAIADVEVPVMRVV